MKLNMRIFSIFTLLVVVAMVIGSVSADSVGLYPGCLDSEMRWGMEPPALEDSSVIVDEADVEIVDSVDSEEVSSNHTPQYLEAVALEKVGDDTKPKQVSSNHTPQYLEAVALEKVGDDTKPKQVSSNHTPQYINADVLRLSRENMFGNNLVSPQNINIFYGGNMGVVNPVQPLQ